ncbi:MAG: hypothetical protein JO076_00985, partial [Verrucomicrobia bacterium]|nr:hypothetical protein [Verrucomicrobiota bacterium]
MSRVVWTGLLVISYWFLSANSVAAQQSAPAQSKPSTPSVAPTPIPLSEVAAQAESALDSLRNIQQSLSADQRITRAQKSLTRLERELILRANENEKFLSAGVPLEFLRRLEIVAKTFSDELAHWNHDLSEFSRTLDSYNARLSRLNTIWELTLQSPEISKSGSAVLKRGHDLLENIHRTLEEVQSRTAAVLALEDRVLESATLAETTSNSIEEAKARAVKNLFVPGAPPIWSGDLRKGIEAGQVLFYWRA